MTAVSAVRKPRSGDVLHLTRAASVQFVEPLLFRVIRRHDWVTYEGWVWLDGYELNAAGDAVDRRSLFVRIAGIRYVNIVADQVGRRGGPVNTRAEPVQGPAAQQRNSRTMPPKGTNPNPNNERK